MVIAHLRRWAAGRGGPASLVIGRAVALMILATTMGGVAMAEDPSTALVVATERPAEFLFPATTIGPAQPELEFRTAELPGFLWFETPEPVEEFAAAGAFDRLEIRMRGYVPTDRDRFEVTILTAHMRPERIAMASDIARLFLARWASEIGDGIVHDGATFGEAVGHWRRDGFDKTLRVAVWRRGASLLIVRAEMDSSRAAQDFAALAPFLGSVRFLRADTDPLPSAFKPWQVALPGHVPLSFDLPPNWQLTVRRDATTASEGQAVLVFTDQTPGQMSPVLLVGLAEFPPAPFPDITAAAARIAPKFREMATVMSDTAVEAASGEAGFARQEKTQIGYAGEFAIGGANAEFRDRLQWPDGSRLGADTLVAWRPGEVLGLAMLMPWPDTLPDMAAMLHANFVMQHVITTLRGPFAPQSSP